MQEHFSFHRHRAKMLSLLIRKYGLPAQPNSREFHRLKNLLATKVAHLSTQNLSATKRIVEKVLLRIPRRYSSYLEQSEHFHDRHDRILIDFFMGTLHSLERYISELTLSELLCLYLAQDVWNVHDQVNQKILLTTLCEEMQDVFNMNKREYKHFITKLFDDAEKMREPFLEFEEQYQN